MKPLLTSLAAIVLLAGCSSNDQPQPEPQPQPKPVAETWYLDSWNEDMQSGLGPIETGDNFRYVYNADSTIAKMHVDTVGPENKSDLAHTDYYLHYKNGLLERISYRQDHFAIEDIYSFTLNAAGLITDSRGRHDYKMMYDNEKRLIRLEEWSGIGSERPYIFNSWDYTWTGDNVTYCTEKSGSEVIHYSITYNNRKIRETSAGSMIPLATLLGIISGPNFELGVNEIATITVKDANNKLLRSKSHSYTYNERGQRATMKTAFMRADGSQDFAYYYTYNYKKH